MFGVLFMVNALEKSLDIEFTNFSSLEESWGEFSSFPGEVFMWIWMMLSGFLHLNNSLAVSLSFLEVCHHLLNILDTGHNVSSLNISKSFLGISSNGFNILNARLDVTNLSLVVLFIFAQFAISFGLLYDVYDFTDLLDTSNDILDVFLLEVSISNFSISNNFFNISNAWLDVTVSRHFNWVMFFDLAVSSSLFDGWNKSDGFLDTSNDVLNVFLLEILDDFFSTLNNSL